MEIHKYIEQRLTEILNQYKDTEMSEEQLLVTLRQEINETNLVNWLRLKFMQNAFDKYYIILSPALLKLLFDKVPPIFKDRSILADYPIELGNHDRNSFNVNSKKLDIVSKGLFVEIIEMLGLKKSLESYIKHKLIKLGSSAAGYETLNKKDKKDYADYERVLDIFFKELDKKYGNKKIFYYKNRIIEHDFAPLFEDTRTEEEIKQRNL